MTPEQIVERERRWALPVAVATFGVFALLVAGIIVNQGAPLSDADTDSEFLREFAENSGQLLAAATFQAGALALLIVPLVYLFQAAAARSETMRRAMIGITIAGPLFLAAGAILRWVGFDAAAEDFATPGGGTGVPVGEYVEDLIADQWAFEAAQGFTFAGTLGMVVGLVYTSLNAMRVGLLTRFWGTLGMALGVSVLFLGFLGVMIFFIALGLLIAGRWPGGRPPAWEEGRAIPWPRPGEEPAAGDEEEPAIEGLGSEVREREEAEAPSSPPSSQRRKRKRRG